jgi:hypothetical protein
MQAEQVQIRISSPPTWLKLPLQCARSSDDRRGVVAGEGVENEDGKRVSAVAYMELILLDERRWAYFYRQGCLTLGIASTQRCEGSFSKLKQALGRISTLQHLASTVATISECDELETRILRESLSLKQSTHLHSGLATVSCS